MVMDEKKKLISLYFVLNLVILLGLLIFTSPVYCLIGLGFSTMFFIYMRNFKQIALLWGIVLFIWYSIFTITLINLPTIVIGFEHTKLITDYLLDNNFLFENLCFQTVYLLTFASYKFNIYIFIPSIYKTLFTLALRLLGKGG